MKSFALFSLERLVADLVTVINARNRAFAGYLEFDQIISSGNKCSILVYYFHSHKGKINAISLDRSAIRNQDDACRFCCGTHLFAQHHATILARYCVQYSRLERQTPEYMHVAALFSFRTL